MQTLNKIYYDKDGWVCERYPYNIAIDDENRYIEVDDSVYTSTLSHNPHYAWRVVNGELVNELYEEIPEEEILNTLREKRNNECFEIIDRSKIWYDTLSDVEYEELKQWYQDWLNVTETKEIPQKPTWLK